MTARAAYRIARMATMIASSAALALGTAGCADFDGTGDPSGGLPDVVVESPSLSAHVQPIFTARCSMGGCHSLASRQGDLVLTADSTYSALVGRPSRLGRRMPLVDPGNPGNSWLLAMIGSDSNLRVGISRMPLASAPLTTNQIATIVNWINRGARRD